MEYVLWVGCGLATIVAAPMAVRSRRARVVGRAAVGILFLFGGALVNGAYLVSGRDYVGFADEAHFAWVTDAWRAVVGPNVELFIGLLVAFEAAVGLLVLSGGRRIRLGYAGVLGFYSALWLFGWFTTVWVLLMLPATAALLRAELHADRPIGPEHRIGERPVTAVGGRPRIAAGRPR